jgi:hypothetical protein
MGVPGRRSAPSGMCPRERNDDLDRGVGPSSFDRIVPAAAGRIRQSPRSPARVGRSPCCRVIGHDEGRGTRGPRRLPADAVTSSPRETYASRGVSRPRTPPRPSRTTCAVACRRTADASGLHFAQGEYVPVGPPRAPTSRRGRRSPPPPPQIGSSSFPASQHYHGSTREARPSPKADRRLRRHDASRCAIHSADERVQGRRAFARQDPTEPTLRGSSSGALIAAGDRIASATT